MHHDDLEKELRFVKSVLIGLAILGVVVVVGVLVFL